MKTRSISRRSLLRGGASAAMLALPLLQSLVPRRARADQSTPPKRVIFFFTPNGFPMEHWRCAVDPSNPSSFALSPILAPLAAHKADCLFVEGVPMSSSFDPAQNATAHEGGCASVLTGSWAGEGEMFGGGSLKSGFSVSESLDNFIATQIGQTTRYPAYHLSVLPSLPYVGSRPFNAGPSQPISPNPSPHDAFDQLFGELVLGSAAVHKRHVERKLVLETATAELEALSCKLSSDDRQRLELHVASLDKIIAGLGKLPSANCTPPSVGAPLAVHDPKLYPTLGQLQMELAVAALRCDVTRVIGLQWHQPGSNLTFSWLGHDAGHHELSHMVTVHAKQRLAEIGAWYAERLAELVTALKNTPDESGSLFDSTLIVWASECGDPWIHDRQEVAFTLIGHCQNSLATGRYLRFSGTEQHNHNRLLLAIAEVAGAGTSGFGASKYSAYGPLTELYV